MNQKKNIFVFTTSRSEFALVNQLLKEFKKSKIFKTKLCVGGSHLLKNYGKTINEIKKEGHKIYKIFNSFSNKDNAFSLINSVSEDLKKLNLLFKKNNCDYVIVFGDRFENLSIIANSILHNKKIVHIGGGEITQGVIDNQIRHMITKAAHFHFTASKSYKNTVIKMGEKKSNVFNVGSLSVDVIKNLKQKNNNIFNKLKLNLKSKYGIMTFHPSNLENNYNSKKVINNIFNALDDFNINIIITYPNIEVGSNKIIKIIKKKSNVKYKLVKSLGFKNFHYLLKRSNFIIGNSSSGIYDAPYYKIPTINIGDRQSGRIMHKSVIHSGYDKNLIKKAIKLALSKNFKSKISKMKYLFGNGTASKKIVKELEKATYS